MSEYILFNMDGAFQGFFTNQNIVEKIISDNSSDMRYCRITEQMKNSLLSKDFNVRVDAMTNTKDIINSDEYIVYTEMSKFDKYMNYIDELLTTIQSDSTMYSAYGVDILMHGMPKHFAYTLNRCTELEHILKNVSGDRTIYYAADGEFAEEYTKDEIKEIHDKLYNNALYNQIYADRLGNWIVHNFTQEMYESKDPIISYGWINDSILKEVEERYGVSKLL